MESHPDEANQEVLVLLVLVLPVFPVVLGFIVILIVVSFKMPALRQCFLVYAILLFDVVAVIVLLSLLLLLLVLR